VLGLLAQLCQPKNLSPVQQKDRHLSAAQEGLGELRLNVLQLVAQLTYPADRSLCSAVVREHKGSIVSLLLNCIQSEAPQRGSLHVTHVHMQSLSLLILRNLAVSRVLSYSQLVDITHTVFAALADISESPLSVMFRSAGFTLLAGIYTLATTASLNEEDATSYGAEEGEADPLLLSEDEMRKLAYIISQAALATPQVVGGLISLLSLRTDGGQVDRHIGTRADPALFAMGLEFGVRHQGLLDGGLAFLAALATSNKTFIQSSDATLLAELVCRQLNSAVSTLFCFSLCP
jgi:hypothetical protein